MFGRSRRTSVLALATAGIVSAATLVLLPSTTAARTEALHLHLKRAAPAVNSTITGSPPEIRLWFSEPVALKTTSVKVAASSGIAVGLGRLSRDTRDTAQTLVVAKVLKPMAPGRYTLTWRAMGDDSHVVKNHYTFTIAAGKAAAGR